jgi:hypothetical protein
MHHEGSRNGISQFNKVSRFVDEPEVLESLDRCEEREDAVDIDLDDGDDILPYYDKRSLLRGVIDRFP